MFNKNNIFIISNVASVLSTSSGANPGVLTTITLINSGGSTQAAGKVTQVMGCPFKQGDIPSGQWPKFQTTIGATSVKCTILNNLATYWPDGSLKYVPVVLMLPSSIASSGTLSIDVLAGGSLPSASARGTSDFSNGITPQIQATGLDNLSGVWTADLTQGISANIKIVTYGNGDCGWFGKVRTNFRQSGADHGQLVCDFYLASLANNDGSLKGMRALGKVKLPYYNGTSPNKNWMSFSTFAFYSDNGVTVVRDCMATNFGAARAKTFTAAGGVAITSTHGYATTNGGDYGYALRLTTTGTLPSGFSSSTTYFSNIVNSTTMQFCSNSQNPSGHTVSSGSAGTGTHTWTPYPYLCYFGALFTASPTGTQDWMQGAGSDAADSTLRYQINKRYWVSTKMLPPYDITTNPTSNSSYTYWPNCSGPVTRFLEQSGERDDLGVMPAWYARHFLTQAAVDEQIVRITSLVGGHFSVGVESSATLSFPCANNGSNGAGLAYSGMPTPLPTFRWLPSVTSVFGAGNSDTTNASVLIAGFFEQDTTHMPMFNYYPYLFTGDPWHLDMLLEHAHSGLIARLGTTGTANISSTNFQTGTAGSGVRNITFGASTIYGALIGCYTASQRADSWAICLMGAAAGIIPASMPGNTSYSTYFPDIIKATGQAQVAIINTLNSGGATYAYNNGLWSTPYQVNWPIIDQWMGQGAYGAGGQSLAYALTQDSNLGTALQNSCAWIDHVVSAFGGWHVGCEETLVKTANAEGSPLATSDATIGFHGPNINWSSGTNLFTNFGVGNNNSTNYVATNNDRIIFMDPVTGDLPAPTPAGFSKYTAYYVVNASGSSPGAGNTFKLSATQGGSPITLTDTYSGAGVYYVWWSAAPSTGSINAMATSGYNTIICGGQSYAYALGKGPLLTTLNDLVSRNTAFGISYTSDPKWNMITTFSQ